MTKPARFVTVLAGALVACLVMGVRELRRPPRSAGKAATAEGGDLLGGANRR